MASMELDHMEHDVRKATIIVYENSCLTGQICNI